jgi:integrase
MYPHRYKAGKQKAIMPLAIFQAAIGEAIDRGEGAEALAYVTLLWHTGVRKSEAYERKLEDITITEKFVEVDFHKRKKGGEEVEPLQIPRAFYGVEDYLVPWAQTKRKATKKRVYYQRATDSTRLTEKGKTVSIKVKDYREERAVWLFPNIHSTHAWEIVKRVLGPDYYPHYLRLRKLSAAGRTATNYVDMIGAVKAISGLKTINAISAYLGSDEQVAKKAMEGSE